MPTPRLAALALLFAAHPAAAQPQPVRPADPALGPVPTDALAFVSVKVSKLWDHPAAKPVRDWVAAQTDGPLDAVFGLPPADLDRVTAFVPALEPQAGNEPVWLVTARKPFNEARVLKALGVGENPRARPGRAGGRVFELDGPFRWVALVDDRTLLFVPERFEDGGAVALLAQLVARKADGPLAPALLAAQVHDVAAGVNVRALGGLVAELANERARKELAPYQALLRARAAALVADFDRAAKVRFVMNFADADEAKRAAPVLAEGLKAVADELGGESAKAEPVPAALAGWAAKVLAGAKVAAAGPDVTAAADVPFDDDVAKLAAALPKSARVARGTVRATNNLKQIGLAFHNHESAFQYFPGDVGFGAGKDLPAMSWRVQVLPFLEQENLYKQLDLRKPWDDPANLKVLEAAEMPKVFEHPGRPAPKGHTYFRVFSFPRNAKGFDRPALDEGQRGPKVASFTDGLSNTFLVVEAGEAVPWYKPDVLAYDGKLPLPQLGDKDAARFLAVMGDGSVRAVSRKADEKVLRALITRAGGEVVADPDR
jgi:hypothetical protein